MQKQMEMRNNLFAHKLTGQENLFEFKLNTVIFFLTETPKFLFLLLIDVIKLNIVLFYNCLDIYSLLLEVSIQYKIRALIIAILL